MTTPNSIKYVRLKADLALALAAIIWGSAFVAQRMAASQLGTFIFNGSRFLLGAIILWFFNGFKIKIDRKLIPQVMLAGLILFGGSAFQQAGLITTTAGNAGFITGLYVIFVPIVLTIFWRRKHSGVTWFSALLACIGIYLLSVSENFSFHSGDILELIGAFVWAFHVIIVARCVGKIDIVSFSIAQCMTCALLNLILGFTLEWHTIPAISTTWSTIIYTGIFSVGVAYTLQAFGQKHSPPADCAIILGTESIFAAVCGYFILGEILTTRQIIGCGLILFAALLAQLWSINSQYKNNGLIEKQSAATETEKNIEREKA